MTHKLTGSLIGGVFGLIFVLVNSGALDTTPALVLRVLAVVAFVAVLVQIGRHTPPAGTTTYGSERGGFGRGYWAVVIAEVVAIIGGNAILRALDRPDAGVAWVAFVVGVHFFALARVWNLSVFNLLGGALVLCGAVGLALAFADVDQAAVATVGGVLPGAVLLGFALWGSRTAV